MDLPREPRLKAAALLLGLALHGCVAAPPGEPVVVDAGRPAPFEVDDQIVQALELDVIDSEIAESAALLAWQSREHRLKVTPIDTSTGAFAWDRTEDVDAMLPFSETGNGPEIGLGTEHGTTIVYHKLVGGEPVIAHAWRAADGGWNTRVQQLPIPGLVPFASQVSAWSAPLISFRSPARTGQRTLRAWTEAGSDRWGVFPEWNGRGPNAAVPLRGDRGDRRYILLDYRVDPWNQLFAYDVDGQDLIAVTDDARFKTRGAIMFTAPELGDRPMVVAATTEQPDRSRGDRASVYWLTDAGWQSREDLRPPSELPYLHSLEPFVFAGQTYLSYFMTDGLGFGESTRNEMWISAIDGSLHRRVSSPEYESGGREIFDPETLATGETVWLYYTEMYPNNVRVTHRAATGLRR